MQQLLEPSVFLTLAPNVQSLSLNTRNFLISEPLLLLYIYNRIGSEIRKYIY